MSYLLCPKCGSVYAYVEADKYVCPDCNYECTREKVGAAYSMRPSCGSVRLDGEAVALMKPLKQNASSIIVDLAAMHRESLLKGPEFDPACGSHVTDAVDP